MNDHDADPVELADEILEAVDVEAYDELRRALRSIVEICDQPPDREMHPKDAWLPALNTCRQIAEEALDG